MITNAFKRPLGRLVNKVVIGGKKWKSTAVQTQKLDIFNPTEEHLALREMLSSFVKSEVDPQALEYNKREEFNVDLFRKLGELGLLGITVPAEYGGSEMDATAAVIAHEELAASRPGAFHGHEVLHEPERMLHEQERYRG